MLADTGSAPESGPTGWLRAERRWVVPDVATAKALVASGRAFAVLPEDDVAKELARGELVRLVDPSRSVALQVHVVEPKADRTGPAARALAEAFRALRA